jgi:sugar lactone lactonase YvrE
MSDSDNGLTAAADLTALGPPPFNELVVAANGNAYVNGGPGLVVCVQPDSGVREVADGLKWPNGMAIVDDGRTLVVADSHVEQLIGFAVSEDGALTDRRVWAELEYAPDGICADADGAVWVASVRGQYSVPRHYRPATRRARSARAARRPPVVRARTRAQRASHWNQRMPMPANTTM